MNMSDFDDDEPIDEPFVSKVDGNDVTYKLTIEDLPHEAIMQAVCNRIATHTEAKLTAENTARIRATIAECVDKAVIRIVETRLETEVNRLIDQGWDEHDTWGQRTGKKFTLAERITTYLQHQVDANGSSDNRYSSSDKRQRIVWYVEKAVQTIFDKESTKLVDDFKKQVREKFTKELSDRVAATLKDALGLR